MWEVWDREETSAHVLCDWEALVSLRCTYLGSFFLDPEDFRNLSLRATWNFRNGTGVPRLDIRLWDTKGPFKRPRCIGTKRARIQSLFYSILFCSTLFYSILFYSILFYSILFYSILFHSILFCSTLFYSVLFYSVPLYSILFYSILFYSILFYSILFYSILFHSI